MLRGGDADMGFAPTLREGLYVHRGEHSFPNVPFYVHVKETSSSFIFTWSEKNKAFYKGTVFEDDIDFIVRSTAMGSLLKPDKNGKYKFTLKKAGSQHAIEVNCDGSFQLYPYRNGAVVPFEMVHNT